MALGGPVAAAASVASAEAPAVELALEVVVSIAPLQGLIEPMLPAGSRVTLLIPPGVSEHGYEIPPSRLAALARADLVVTVGLGLEPQVTRFLSSRPREGRVEVELASAAKIDAEAQGLPGSGGHDHDHDHEHGPGCDHGAVDPHIWLDPVLMREAVPALAEAIKQAAARRGAAGGLEASAAARVAGGVDAGASVLSAKLDGLDAAYAAVFARAARSTIVVGHDAYGWMARRYRFTTVPIKGLTATEPTPRALEAALRAVRDHSLPAVFVEPQLSSAAGRRIASATGARVMTLDPLGAGDYFAMMRANLAAIAQVVGVRDEAAAGAGASAGSGSGSGAGSGGR